MLYLINLSGLFLSALFNYYSNISQSTSNAGAVQPQQPDMPIKYEFEPYPMHHPLATNLDGAAGGMPIMNKHQSQQPCSIDFGRHNARGIHDIVGHNHTYTLPQASGATPRSQIRDKKNSRKAEEEHLTRDEKRARALGVSVCEIFIHSFSIATLEVSTFD